MKPVDKSNQLYIQKRGLIITIRDKNKNWYSIPMSHIRAMIFGSLPYIYANEWTPKPVGRPKGSKDSYPRETPKKEIIIPLKIKL